MAIIRGGYGNTLPYVDRDGNMTANHLDFPDGLTYDIAFRWWTNKTNKHLVMKFSNGCIKVIAPDEHITQEFIASIRNEISYFFVDNEPKAPQVPRGRSISLEDV